jgi:hypothetical protein
MGTGQILFEVPDMARFKKQAEVYGYDLDAYSEALRKVPIVSEDQFKNILSFLNKLAVLIAETGLNKLKDCATGIACANHCGSIFSELERNVILL